MKDGTVAAGAGVLGDVAGQERWVAGVWAALAVAGIALFANQYVTLPAFKAVLLSRTRGEPVAALSGRVWDVLLDWRAFVGPGDVLILGVFVSAVAYLAYAELRHFAMTALLRRVSDSPRTALALLMLATLVGTRAYLAPGEVFMGDSESHTLRSWMFAEHFRRLELPTWSNVWYGGFPPLSSYGPLYFAATALLTLALGDVHTATKLLQWSCHVGSVVAMFAFLRQATRHTLAAFVGALAYAVCAFRLFIILYQGDLQVGVVLLLVPLLLSVTERFLINRARARRTFLLLVLLLSVFLLTHHGFAFFGMVFFTIYVLARVALLPGPRANQLRLLGLFASAELAALLIAAYLLIPFLFDRSELRGMSASALPVLIPNPVGALLLLPRLFGWAATGNGTSVGYVGISIGLLGAAGAWHAIRRREPVALALVMCTAASLLMVRDRVPHNVRNVDFFMVFVCALGAWGLIALLQPRGTAEDARSDATIAWTPRDRRVVGGVLLLMLLDVGPATFQSVFRENHDFAQRLYRQLGEVEQRPYRIVERQVRLHDPTRPPDAFFEPTRTSVPSAYAFTQTPLGSFHEGSGQSFGYHAEILKRVHIDLNRGDVSELSLAGLYMIGVGDVLFRDQVQRFTPQISPSDAFDVSNGRLRLRDASPLIVSRRVIALSDIEGYPATDLIRGGGYFEAQLFDYTAPYYRELVEPVIRRMALDRERGRAATLVARDAAQRLDLGAAGDLDVVVDTFATDLKRTRIQYRASAEAVGQLAFTYFPHLDVRVDGRPVPFFRSAFGSILLRLPIGQHVISVAGALPPLQRRMLWVSLAALVTVLLLPAHAFSAFELHRSTGGS